MALACDYARGARQVVLDLLLEDRGGLPAIVTPGKPITITNVPSR